MAVFHQQARRRLYAYSLSAPLSSQFSQFGGHRFKLGLELRHRRLAALDRLRALEFPTPIVGPDGREWRWLAPANTVRHVGYWRVANLLPKHAFFTRLTVHTYHPTFPDLIRPVPDPFPKRYRTLTEHLPNRFALSGPIVQIALYRPCVPELGLGRVKLHAHFPGGPVAMLGHDQLVFVFVGVDQDHHVRILFDTAAIP